MSNYADNSYHEPIKLKGTLVPHPDNYASPIYRQLTIVILIIHWSYHIKRHSQAFPFIQLVVRSMNQPEQAASAIPIIVALVKLINNIEFKVVLETAAVCCAWRVNGIEMSMREP